MKAIRIFILLGLLVGVSSCTGDGKSDLERELDSIDAKVMRHEQLIAECMAGKGWEYIPSMPRDVIIERQKRLADAEGRAYDPKTAELPDDPNTAIVARLSEADRNARSNAYWGDIQEGGSDPGCYQSTYKQAWGSIPGDHDPDAQQRLAEAEAAIAADERVIAALADFVNCMASRGFPVSGLHDIFRQYDTRVDALAEELRAKGEDPDRSPQMKRLRAEQRTAYQAYSECEVAYNTVENEVRMEKLKEHGL